MRKGRGHGDKLEMNEEKAIIALLSCGTHEEAATQIGVSVTTVRRWLLIPSFAGRLARARRQMLDRGLSEAAYRAVARPPVMV